MTDFNSKCLPDHILKRMLPGDRPEGVAGMTSDQIYDKNEKKSERELQDQIESFCRMKGWLAFRSRMDRKTNRTKGEFDFHCLLPKGCSILMECKTNTGKLSEDQIKISAQMKELGHTMHVVRSLEEFVQLAQKLIS